MLEYDPGYGPLVDTTVRIATWNLWGRYGPWEARMPAIEATLRRIDADIVALQEVWEDAERNQADALAAALGYTKPVFAANLDRDGVRSGNAVMARWPIARRDVRVLPRDAGIVRDDEGEERLCVFAEVDGPRGPIQMFCAHLSWSADHSAVRQLQVADICEFVRSTRPRPFPAVLCGDLNAEPHSDEIRMLTGHTAVSTPRVIFRDAWVMARRYDSSGFTIDATNPFVAATLDRDMRIDYVLAGQPKLGGAGHILTARVDGNQPVDGMWPSDHFAVVAELRY